MTKKTGTMNMPFNLHQFISTLALSWQRSLSNRNQSIDLYYESTDWFLYDRDLRQERVQFWQNMYEEITVRKQYDWFSLTINQSN